MTYKAYVITASDILPHPNADNLNLLRYNGVQFVVSKNLTPGTTVVLFPEDGQLSHEFCCENNLYRDASLNKVVLKKGFFDENRRVRAQPFRGQKSYGFVADLSMFEYLGKLSLSVGDEFDSLNGKKVCEKYYTPETLRRMNSVQGKKQKNIEYTLKEHYETEKYSYNPPVVPEPSLLVVTEKVHGTSQRTGNVKVIRRMTGFLKFLYGLFGKSEQVSYELVTGTRRTIVNGRADVTTEGQQDYYRWEIHNKIAPLLHSGESIYYEIVGYDSNGGTIMEKQTLSKIQDKSKLNPTWRNPMIYSYGLPEGERDIYVYRITRTSEDGTETELPWFQVEQRSRELGLKTVPILHKGLVNSFDDVDKVVKSLVTDSSSTLDERHLMEGICIRIESSQGISVLKEKNYLFGVLEGYLKENKDYVDVEESS